MIYKLRLASGLILFGYVLCHFLNHMFLLVSANAANMAKIVLYEPWASLPGSWVLASAGILHVALAFWSVWNRRTFRLKGWEAAQLISGFSIPFLAVQHVVSTGLAETWAQTNGDYVSMLFIQWVQAPAFVALQVAAVAAVWIHGCIGLTYWLRLQDWFTRLKGVLLGAAVAVPTLAVAGYVAGGTDALRQEARDPGLTQFIMDDANVGAPQLAFVDTTVFWILTTLVVLGLVVVVSRYLRRYAVRFGRGVQLSHPHGGTMAVPAGASVLETLRAHDIPHASVCGGRARCTTCRIKAISDAAQLPPAKGAEAAALARIQAPDGVRLACQLRPRCDLAVVPLVTADIAADSLGRLNNVSGREETVAVMFLDIRGSTKLGQEKLPFDVVFILDRFFAEMQAALEEHNGHYAQFNGDGLMALFGLEGRQETAVRDALGSAAGMLGRLEHLNASLASELKSPLRMGIGIHFGEAIVGEMGPPKGRIVSAIGDTINTAARLEGLCKEHSVPFVLSEKAAEEAGLTLADEDRHAVEVRGRQGTTVYYALAEVPEC